MLPAVHRTAGNAVVAVAGRAGGLDAAAEVARPFGARVHDGYDALLGDPDVDAVYIALPNSLHVPWTLRALDAGKHVLVEKPMALSEEDCVRIERAAADLVVMEAYMYRFHPQQVRAAQMLASGEIGELRVVRSAFAYPTAVEGNIRFDPALGGGATWDVGCYAFDVPLWAFDAEPRSVRARFHSRRVDLSAVATLDFGDGRWAVLDYSLEYGPRATYEFQGTRGSISVRNAWTRPDEQGVITVVTLDGVRDEVIPASDAYGHQAAAFAEAVREKVTPLVSLAHSARTARVGQALVRSAATGAEVDLRRRP